MAAEDPAALVTLELTFWHKDKKPGDRVQVRREDLRSWHGFAKPVTDEAADTSAPKAAAKTSTTKQA